MENPPRHRMRPTRAAMTQSSRMSLMTPARVPRERWSEERGAASGTLPSLASRTQLVLAMSGGSPISVSRMEEVIILINIFKKH